VTIGVGKYKKAFDNLGNSGIISKKDNGKGSSLGALAFKEVIKLPNGQLPKISEGTKITKIIVLKEKRMTTFLRKISSVLIL